MMNHRLSEKEKEALRDIFLVLETKESFMDTFRSFIERFKMIFFVKPTHAC